MSETELNKSLASLAHRQKIQMSKTYKWSKSHLHT